LPESEADARSLEFFLAMLAQSKKKGAFAPCKDIDFFPFSSQYSETPSLLRVNTKYWAIIVIPIETHPHMQEKPNNW
jgi:hypothetical protein